MIENKRKTKENYFPLEYVLNSDLVEETKVQRKKRCEKKIRILISVWNSNLTRREKR